MAISEIFHNLAHGILPQRVVYNHTYKFEHQSMMMTVGPPVKMPGCLLLMVFGHLPVIMSESLLIMTLSSEKISEGPLEKISKGPSEKIFEKLSEKISERPLEKNSEGPSEKISEQSAEKISEQSSEKISEQPLEKISEQPLEKISEGPSEISEGPSEKISEQPSEKISERPSEKISERPSEKIFEQSAEKISEQSSEKISERLLEKISEGPSEKISEEPSEISEIASKKISEVLLEKISEGPSEKISEGPSEISEVPSKKISEKPSEKISEGPSEKISEGPSEKFSEGPSEKISERPPEKISEGPSEKISEGPSEKISEGPLEKFSKIPGYTGLVNQGATCYLNTVLQILFMTEEFREAVKGYNPHNCNSNMNNHIAQLFKRLKSGEKTTAITEGITSALKINVHKQEDAAKCLQKILNKIDPEISKIFQGTKVDKTICKFPAKNHEPLKQVKTFFIISISLESQDHINMQSCFESYFAPIIMSGEDQQIHCKDCEMLMDTEIICSLRSVPSVLVLHLERFELDYDTMCCVKNKSTVEISSQLIVKDEDGVNHTYYLYAIANHAGSLSGGHYYADIRSFEDQQWYRFNDSSVQKMCVLDKPLLSDEAYLLLYKKSAVVSTASQSQTAEDEPNKKEEGSRCENPEKDETIPDIKVDLESHYNSSLAEQQEESPNTSVCDGSLDIPEITVVTTDHQHPSSLSENSDHEPETNASAQQIVSDEVSQSSMGIDDVPNTSEIVNQRKKIINMYENRSSFWRFIVFSLAIFIIIIIIILHFFSMQVG